MNRTHQLFNTSALATLMGCSADPGAGDPSDSVEVGSTHEAVTLVDCQKQVATCVQTAKSLSDLGHCTAQFQACSTQAAADLTGHTKLLSDCRASANQCLDGALTSLDISKCRDVFDSCAKDVTTTANGALGDAISTAKTAVGKVTQTAITTINAAGGAVTGALDAVNSCVKDSNACFSGASILADVTQCEKAAQACVNQAVTLVDNVTDPLPGPNPGQLATTLTQCQDQVTSCLGKAVTSVDIAACKGALTLCVNGATGIVDQTVTDLTGLIAPILPIPAPKKPIDCSSAAAQCLLSMSSPLDCATQAAQCLTK